jgi:cell division protein FtsX
MSYQNIKEEVVKITKDLSIEDVNDIFYRIILEKKLEQAEDDIKSGRVYTTEQAKEKLKKWFK